VPASPSPSRSTRQPGEQVERHLSATRRSGDGRRTRRCSTASAATSWTVQKVPVEKLETVKLKNVVPPIHFESGVAKIPPSYVDKLATILEGMRYRKNVRLHFVGHADSQPLSDAGARLRGQQGLSRERAGEVAEYFKKTLGCRPRRSPTSGPATRSPWPRTEPKRAGAEPSRRGGGLVRRGPRGPKDKEVVVADDIKRIKVCRMETLCKLRYKEGQARRAASRTSSCRCGTRTRHPDLRGLHPAGQAGARPTCGTSST
jgi:hypothetical protein